MEKELDKIDEMVAYIRSKTDFKPDVCVILGSGLGLFVEQSKMEIMHTFFYKDIPNFPVSTVSGHAGKLILGRLGDVNVICMQGRVHYYEGYSMQQVVRPIRMMGRLGARKLILTNAAGGVNESFSPGDFCLITDHISSFIPSPLIGPNEEEFGVRFPDMSKVYHPDMIAHIKKAADKISVSLKSGVYIQLSGPQYETPAEIRMVRMLGADAVGMSTVCEAIAANHMGMKVGAISLITNMACGVIKDAVLSHEEVKETADQAANKFSMLISEVIKSIKDV